jgi:hypothetical protein
MLGTHDDHTLVERLRRQPRMVTMLRDPVERFLSAYEFAVEVSARSFGDETTVAKNRVATRDVWPWEHCVRRIDEDLRAFKRRTKAANFTKPSGGADCYDNSIYTPLRDFVDLDIAHDDLHNGQFMQLLGLTSQADATLQPDYRAVRGCLKPGGEDANTAKMLAFAEKRLRDEMDATVVHERLDDALRFSSAALELPMAGPAYDGNKEAGDGRVGELKTAVASAKRGARAGENVAGFTFKFLKVTDKQLANDAWREKYEKALAAQLARYVGVAATDVRLLPPLAADGTEERPRPRRPPPGKRTGANGTVANKPPPPRSALQVALVKYPSSSSSTATSANASGGGATAGDKLRELFAMFDENPADVSSTIVNASDGFGQYGALTAHAWATTDMRETNGSGRNSLTGDVTVTVTQRRPVKSALTLGSRFRKCESENRAKYARQKRRAFEKLAPHVDGVFDPFRKSDRARIPAETLARVRAHNFLDVRLWEYATRLFEERMEERREEVEREILPPKPPPSPPATSPPPARPRPPLGPPRATGANANATTTTTTTTTKDARQRPPPRPRRATDANANATTTPTPTARKIHVGIGEKSAAAVGA